MPWNALTNLADGNGFWAFLGAVFTAACFAAVGFVKILFLRKTSRDTDLAERENMLVNHLAAEISRLNGLVLNLDTMMKMQSSEHREALLAEREECNVRMIGMQGEIDILKRRMTEEESR
tara:strand:+ start:4568 stop:4927 length:360 start_codon:yes stop_codon:yes gene_type:complete